MQIDQIAFIIIFSFSFLIYLFFSSISLLIIFFTVENYASRILEIRFYYIKIKSTFLPHQRNYKVIPPIRASAHAQRTRAHTEDVVSHLMTRKRTPAL